MLINMWAQIRRCKESNKINTCHFPLLKTIKIMAQKTEMILKQLATLVVGNEAEKQLKVGRVQFSKCSCKQENQCCGEIQADMPEHYINMCLEPEMTIQVYSLCQKSGISSLPICTKFSLQFHISGIKSRKPVMLKQQVRPNDMKIVGIRWWL